MSYKKPLIKITLSMGIATLMASCGQPKQKQNDLPNYTTLADKNAHPLKAYNETNGVPSEDDKTIGNIRTWGDSTDSSGKKNYGEISAVLGNDKSTYRGYTGKNNLVYYMLVSPQGKSKYQLQSQRYLSVRDMVGNGKEENNPDKTVLTIDDVNTTDKVNKLDRDYRNTVLTPSTKLVGLLLTGKDPGVLYLHAQQNKAVAVLTNVPEKTIGASDLNNLKGFFNDHLLPGFGSPYDINSAYTRFVTYGRNKSKNPYNMQDAPLIVHRLKTYSNSQKDIKTGRKMIFYTSDLTILPNLLPETEDFVIAVNTYEKDASGNYVRTYGFHDEAKLGYNVFDTKYAIEASSAGKNPVSCNNYIDHIDRTSKDPNLRLHITAEWCISMPGGDTTRPLADLPADAKKTDVSQRQKHYEQTKSNVAAARVVGALSMLRNRFPELTTTELRRRMLATASHETADGKKLKIKTTVNKKTTYSNPTFHPCKRQFINGKTQQCSDEYGRGTVRLDEAFKSIGQTKIASYGNNLKNARLVTTGETFLKSSPLFGDGFEESTKNKKVALFDQMGATFFTPLSAFTRSDNTEKLSMFDKGFVTLITAQQHGKQTTTHQITNLRQIPLQVSWLNKNYAQKSLGFASNANEQRTLMGQNTIRIRVAYSPMEKSTDRTLYITSYVNKDTKSIMQSIQYKHNVMGVTIRPSYKVLYEKGQVLGTQSNGAFNMGVNAVSHFVQMNINTPIRFMGINPIHISAFMNQGYTKSYGLETGLIDSIGTIQTTAMGLYINKTIANKSYGVGMSAPLRVTNAPITLRYATTRDRSQNLSYTTQDINAKPSGNERTMETFFTTQKGATTIKTSLLYTIDKNHIVGNNDASVNFFLTRSF